MNVVFEPKMKTMMGPKRKQTYEYWMDGVKYRILQLTQPPTPEFDYDVRWNGERFQCLMVDNSELIVSTNANRNTSYISIVPLLRPFQFLFPNGGPNAATYMTWNEARSNATRDRLASAQLVQNAARENLEATFPGGIDFDGERYVYHIHFDGSPGFLPSKIREVSSSGIDLLTTELWYQPIRCDAGVAYLPSSVKVTSRDSQNNVVWVSTVNVTALEVDQPIPPEIFTVDFQTVRNVIDDDHPPVVGEFGNPTTQRSGAQIIQMPTSPLQSLGASDDANEHSWQTPEFIVGCGGIFIVIVCLIALYIHRSRTKAN